MRHYLYGLGVEEPDTYTGNEGGGTPQPVPMPAPVAPPPPVYYIPGTPLVAPTPTVRYFSAPGVPAVSVPRGPMAPAGPSVRGAPVSAAQRAVQRQREIESRQAENAAAIKEWTERAKDLRKSIAQQQTASDQRANRELQSAAQALAREKNMTLQQAVSKLMRGDYTYTKTPMKAPEAEKQELRHLEQRIDVAREQTGRLSLEYASISRAVQNANKAMMTSAVLNISE